MNKFYYRIEPMHNSWLNNPRDHRKVIRVENVHPQLFNKELAAKIRQLCADDEIGILIEDSREPISSMLPHNGWLKYEYYSLLIEGKDHCGWPIKYRFVIGASDFIGNTSSLKQIAFNKLQKLLMTEGIGCLRTDVELSKMMELTYEKLHE